MGPPRPYLGYDSRIKFLAFLAQDNISGKFLQDMNMFCKRASDKLTSHAP